MCQEKLELLNMNRVLRKFLDQVPLKGCPLCKKENLNYEQLLGHLHNECPSVPVICTNEECKEIFNRDQAQDHKDRCAAATFDCDHCGLSDLRMNTHHSCLKSLRQTVAAHERMIAQ